MRNREEKRCTLVGMTSDVCLSVLKIVTGFVGHSSAILADGIHSISDTVTDALGGGERRVGSFSRRDLRASS